MSTANIMLTSIISAWYLVSLGFFTALHVYNLTPREHFKTKRYEASIMLRHYFSTFWVIWCRREVKWNKHILRISCIKIFIFLKLYFSITGGSQFSAIGELGSLKQFFTKKIHVNKSQQIKGEIRVKRKNVQRYTPFQLSSLVWKFVKISSHCS